MAPSPHHTTLSPPRHTQPTASSLFPYTLLRSSGLYLMFINVDRHFYFFDSSVNSVKPLTLARLVKRTSYSCLASVLSASSVTFAPISRLKRIRLCHAILVPSLLPPCTSPRVIPLTSVDTIKIMYIVVIHQMQYSASDLYCMFIRAVSYLVQKVFGVLKYTLKQYSVLLGATVAATVGCGSVGDGNENIRSSKDKKQ